jgi:elongation factor 1-gamma
VLFVLCFWISPFLCFFFVFIFIIIGIFRAFKALIAAEYNGVDVKVEEPFNATKVKALSPTGKAPVLETKAGVVFESNAIARHIASLRRDTGLTGSTLYEEAAVDSWVDFGANEVELPASVWFYPVAGYMPFSAPA